MHHPFDYLFLTLYYFLLTSWNVKERWNVKGERKNNKIIIDVWILHCSQMEVKSILAFE
jgi:hypothetical protein